MESNVFVEKSFDAIFNMGYVGKIVHDLMVVNSLHHSGRIRIWFFKAWIRIRFVPQKLLWIRLIMQEEITRQKE